MTIALKAKLLKHQRAAAEASHLARVFAYLMDPRTGKTSTTWYDISKLHAARLITLAIIVVPRGVKEDRVWEQDLAARFHADEHSALIHSYVNGASKHEVSALQELFVVHPTRLAVLIIHWDALTTDRGYKLVEGLLQTHPGNIVVLDEAHRMKTPSARVTKRLMRLKKHTRYRRILTGSLVANTPLDIWAPVNWLHVGILGCPNFYTFKSIYCVLERKRFGRGKGFMSVEGFQRLDQLKAKLAECSFSITLAECTDLPPRQYHKVAVGFSAEQQRVYQQLRDELVSELRGATISAPLAIVRLLRLQQVIGGFVKPDLGQDTEAAQFVGDEEMLLPIEQALLEHVEDDDSPKVVVWAKFVAERKRLIMLLRERLPGHAVMQVPDAGNIALFKAHRGPAVLVASPEGPASEGVDLSCARTMIYYSNSFKLTARVQSEARTENLKNKTPSKIIDLFIPDTVSERVLNRLADKHDVQKGFSGRQLMQWLESESTTSRGYHETEAE